MTGVTYYCKYAAVRPLCGRALTSLRYLISTGTSWAGGATILDYWLPPSRVSNAVWISVFLVIALVVQFMPVRYFGEFEVSPWEQSELIIFSSGCAPPRLRFCLV